MPERQRRLAATMFTDMVGSTALAVDPYCDPIRGAPRHVDLVQRIGLPLSPQPTL